MLFAQDDKPVRPDELFQQGRRLCNRDDRPSTLLGSRLLSGEQGLGSALLEQVTTSDGLLRLGKTPDGLQRRGQDIIGGRVAVIRQLAQEAQRTQVVALRLGTDRLMCPIGKFEDPSHLFSSQVQPRLHSLLERYRRAGERISPPVLVPF